MNSTILGGWDVTEHKMCGLIFLIIFDCDIYHSKNEVRYDKKMSIGLCVKCVLFLHNLTET